MGYGWKFRARMIERWSNSGAGAKFRELAINKTGRGHRSFGIWIEWERGAAESAYLMIFRSPLPSFTKQFPIALSKSSGQKWLLIYRSRIYRPPSENGKNKKGEQRGRRRETEAEKSHPSGEDNGQSIWLKNSLIQYKKVQPPVEIL